MSLYYKPSQISKLGRMVNKMGGYKPKVESNHRLVAIMDNGITRVAVDVASEEDYKRAYTAYNNGIYLEMTVFAVPYDKMPSIIVNLNEASEPSTHGIAR